MLPGQLLSRLDHVVHGVRRQKADVHAEAVGARYGVDVVHGGRPLGRLERGERRREHGVLRGEPFRQEVHQVRKEVGGHAIRVYALVRRGAVDGLPLDVEPHPQQVLLRQPYPAAAGRAPVRYHDDVVAREASVVEQVSYAHLAGGLLVGDISKAYRHPFQLLRKERTRGEERRYYRLPIVLSASAVYPPVLQDRLEGRRVPFVEVSCGDDVRMGHDPHCALLGTDLPGEYVGPLNGRIGEVRNIYPADLVESLEPFHEIVGLPAFPRSPVLRG